MRCPDCNKFVSNDQPDPEVQGLDRDGSTVTAEVRVVIACSECGTELKDSTLTVQVEIDPAIVAAHPDGPDHDLQVEEGAIEPTDRSEGRGRGCRTFYGFRLEIEVSCSCEGPLHADTSDTMTTIEATDDVQSSHMDEC